MKEGDTVKLKAYPGSNRINWKSGTITKIYNTPSMMGEAWITTVEGYKIIEYLEYLEKI